MRLLTLTGCRRHEIGALRRSEIEGCTILLPGSRTKNGEAHAVPLSSAAQAVLATIKPVDGSDFIFGKRPFTSWSKWREKLNELAPIAPWHLHDLRRTLATGLQRLGTQLVVTEAILGHTAGSRGGIVKVYQQFDYLPEKTAALEAWGAHVTALVEGSVRGKVVPFRA